MLSKIYQKLVEGVIRKCRLWFGDEIAISTILLVTYNTIGTYQLRLSPSPEHGNIGYTASVSSDVVNLRASPSTSSNILRRLTPSDNFVITNVNDDGSWYQVQLSGDGTVGWVQGLYVKIR